MRRTDPVEEDEEVRTLSDEIVKVLLTPALAVDAARRAVLDSWHGRLTSPPRLHAAAGSVDLAFTVGGYPDGPVGFRAYGSWPGSSDQAVLVWSGMGTLEGIVVGQELGVRRTGALGAVAADTLAREDAHTVAVIGSGVQAWAQLWALTAVRSVTQARVFSPTLEHRTAFADRARSELGLRVQPVGEAQQAAEGADVIIVATRSSTPVLKDEWVGPGTHLATVGPKLASAHEIPVGLLDRAQVAVSDSPTQAASYTEPFFTGRDLVHLGAVLDGVAPGRISRSDVTVYCSVGLAGSEVVIADAVISAAIAAAADSHRAGSRSPGRNGT